jgi:non-canonical (house-cleaning) NTP pyrophosphatase
MPHTGTALALGSAAAAAACAALLVMRSRRRASSRIAVASTSVQKLDAVRAAFGGQVVGVAAASTVSDQPVGIDETTRGAKNRMLALLEDACCSSVDYAVAIENGLLRSTVGKEELWVDIAVVLVRHVASGKEAVATSAGVQFPTASVGDWAEAGGDGTVGEVIAEDLRCDKQDPHVALTKGAFARTALLEHAIRVAASTLPKVE